MTLNPAALDRLRTGTLPCTGCATPLRQVRDSDEQSYWIAVWTGSSFCERAAGPHTPHAPSHLEERTLHDPDTT